MARDTNFLLELPKELWIEIFLRSSVDSLVRAKCVCKHWYNLIRSPNFAVDHLEYQKSNNKGRLLLQYIKDKNISHALFDDETLVSDTYHDITHFHKFPIGLRTEGPINGLYCLFNCRDRIALWNPSLKELRTLPLPHPHFLPHVSYRTPLEGAICFGIDPLTHDYKVVLIRRFTHEFLGIEICVTVYNLTTNNWRLLDVGDFELRHLGGGDLNSSFLNGTYYWLDSIDALDAVIAFDMWDENFRKLPGPDISASTRFPSRKLTLYNDKVALLRTTLISIDIWVMLEEGVWIKQFSFTSLPKQIKVLGFWKNDGLIFTRLCSDPREYVNPVLYTANTHEMRNLGPIGNDRFFRSSIFYESLVSLESAMEHKERCTSISDFLRHRSNPYLYMRRL